MRNGINIPIQDSEGLQCPHCSFLLKRRGKTDKGRQRYQCTMCRKQVTEDNLVIYRDRCHVIGCYKNHGHMGLCIRHYNAIRRRFKGKSPDFLPLCEDVTLEEFDRLL